MMQLLLARRDIQNKRCESYRYIARYFFSYLSIIADQVGAECLVILERMQPVWCFLGFGYFRQFRKLLMPDRVGGFHGQLVRYLPFAISRISCVGDLPGSLLVLASDNPDSDTGSHVIHRDAGILSNRFRIMDGCSANRASRRK